MHAGEIDPFLIAYQEVFRFADCFCKLRKWDRDIRNHRNISLEFPPPIFDPRPIGGVVQLELTLCSVCTRRKDNEIVERVLIAASVDGDEVKLVGPDEASKVPVNASARARFLKGARKLAHEAICELQIEADSVLAPRRVETFIPPTRLFECLPVST
jgi:hypothetical protein